ncbi:hypothetical protein FIBSPDRAFT_872943 [Athelia psychrophila]|uniref:Uncharacterized protein n=1 Tax=Athelia psychrophila TaxID=1759441 RepID=A0A165YZV0_9AGAM|nr:hypothetical protein FIBSPDRAFT_872943 [Fibularhizoctonia sp. CBS 109695]
MGQVPPMMNPMMGMGGPMAFPPGWGAPNTPGMMPQPGQFGQDATFLAAHQQAMLIAKQTYQMAVAQQAMAAAGEEWERNSNAGGGFGGSSYGGGGGSVYGGGGGSAYGGGAASAYGGGGGSAYGGGAGSVFGGGSTYGGGGSNYGGGGVNPAMPMWGMGGFGMPTNPWSAPSLMVPPSGARSAYGGGFGGGAQSEYGGGGGGGGRSSGWGSKSAYGESFSSPESRPSKSPKSARQRDSYFPPQEPGTRDLRKETSGHSTRADAGSGDSPSRRKQQEQRPGPRARTLTLPSSPAAPRPTSPSRRPQPPSSWGRFGS